MDTLQNAKNEKVNGKNLDFIGNEKALIQQFEIVKSFFQTDSGSEMIGSLHWMIEDFLFSENLNQVTPEMRVHIVNQLRVATLVAKLGDAYNGLKCG